MWADFLVGSQSREKMAQTGEAFGGCSVTQRTGSGASSKATSEGSTGIYENNGFVKARLRDKSDRVEKTITSFRGLIVRNSGTVMVP